MSWQELEEVRKSLEHDLGLEQQAGDDAAQMWPPQHYLENPTAGEPGQLSDLLKAMLEEMGKVKEAKAPSEKKGEPKSPPKGYPESRDQYADPTNYKYPLDTEKHVRAAIGYLSQSDNAAKYTAEERKFMWRRIIRAAKKYDIELSDDVKKRAEEVLAGEEYQRNQDGGGEVDMEKKDVEALILAAIKPVADKVKEQGEAYALQQRNLPPEAVKQMCDEFAAFKAKHAEMEKKIGELTATYPLSAMEAIKTRMDEFEKALKAMKPPGDGNGNGNGDGNGAKAEEKNKGKEQTTVKSKEAVAQGQLATAEMTKEGVAGPPGTPKRSDEAPRGFSEAMNRAGGRQRK